MSQSYTTIEDRILLRISLPAHITSEFFLIKLLPSLYYISKKYGQNNTFSFEFAYGLYGLVFIIACSEIHKNYLEGKIYAINPDISIITAKDYALNTVYHLQKPNTDQGIIEYKIPGKYREDIFINSLDFSIMENLNKASNNKILSLSAIVQNLKLENENQLWIQTLIQPQPKFNQIESSFYAYTRIISINTNSSECERNLQIMKDMIETKIISPTKFFSTILTKNKLSLFKNNHISNYKPIEKYALRYFYAKKDMELSLTETVQTIFW